MASLSRWSGMLLLLCALGAHALPKLSPQSEVEPNETPATATLLSLNGNRAAATGTIAAGDTDVFRLDGLPVAAKIWIYVDTGGTQNAGANSRDSTVALYAADGTTLIESDTNDGLGNGLDSIVEATTGSAIAGRTLAAGGTYYVKVTGATPAAAIDPYTVYVAVTRANLPLAEVEPNDAANVADVLIAAGATSGVRTGSIASALDVDIYKVFARAGDVLFLSVDGDPDRNGTGSGVVAQLLAIDAGTTLISCFVGISGDAAEACAAGYRITNTGTYYIRVQQNSGTGNYALMAATMTPQVIDAVAEVEPNDDFGSATRLVLNRNRAVGAGTLQPGDADIWRVDVRVANSLFALVETGGPTNGTTREAIVELYDHTGGPVQVGSSGTGNGLDGTIETTKSAGVGAFVSLEAVYLKVTAVDPSKTLEYRLYVGVTPYEGSAGNETEPNNTPAAANDMFDGFNLAYERFGTIDGAGDIDWYKVTANAGDVLFAAIDSRNTFTHTGIDMVIDLYATDGTTLLLRCDAGIDGTDLATITEACAYQVGRGGTYYYAVHPFSGAVSTGTYRFLVANMTPAGYPEIPFDGPFFTTETPAKAWPLTLNGWRAVGTGKIDSVGDHDYWRIDGVLPNSTIWVYVDSGINTYGLTTDTNLVLYAADGTTQIESDDDDGTGNSLDGSIESTFASVIAGRTLATGGTYYLKVGHYNNSSTIDPYRIYVAVTPPFLIQSEIEDNGGRLASTIILLPGGQLAARTGAVASAGDADWFKFTADAGDVFFFALDANPARASSGPDLVLDVLDEAGATPLLTCDSSTQSTAPNPAGEGCAYRFPDPGVYYVRVTPKTPLDTGAYAVMVANMSARLTLDIDQSYPYSVYDGLTDGLLAVRHMAVPANTNITLGTTGRTATRSPEEIKDTLDLMTTALDIDADGLVDPATDGLLILRYMMGMRGIALFKDAMSPNARRSQSDVQYYLENLMP